MFIDGRCCLDFGEVRGAWDRGCFFVKPTKVTNLCVPISDIYVFEAVNFLGVKCGFYSLSFTYYFLPAGACRV